VSALAQDEPTWAAILDLLALQALLLPVTFKRERAPVPGPPCGACDGHGSDDGQPCGTWLRDFGPEAPGPCGECDGTGEASNG